MSSAPNAESSVPATVFTVQLPGESISAVIDAAQASNFGLRQFSSGRDFIESTSESVAGCLFLSLQQNKTCKQDLAAITQKYHALPVIVLAENVSAEEAVELMRLGAYSVLTLPVDYSTLAGTIQAAVQTSQSKQSLFDSGRDASRRMTAATAKEIEVLDLIMAGKKNKEIAAALGITVRAVEDRRFRLMRKLRVESVAELVALAVTAQLSTHGINTTAISAANSISTETRTCLKGIEVWATSEKSMELTLQQSVYCDSEGFRDATEGVTFRRGEGLPGKVWEQRAPVFLRELINSDFVRNQAAEAAGVTTAVGLPVFCNGNVASVVVFLLDGRHDVTAAFESWRIDPPTERLVLATGTFINCEKLRRLTEFLHLPQGEGLAGTVAEQARPYATARFQEDALVVREAAFAAERLTSAVALPLTDAGSLVSDVFLVLNGETSPVFTMMQVWKNNGTGLKLTSEFVKGIPSLASQLARVQPEAGSLQMKCLEERQPVIAANGTTIARTTGAPLPKFAIAIPTFQQGKLIAITVLASQANRNGDLS